METTRYAIAGAAGFVGKALLKTLSVDAPVVALTRSATPPPNEGTVEWRTCDLFSLIDAEKALAGVTVAYYLVHSMLPSARLTQGSFEDFDLVAADNFARAAKSNGVERIIYLGGLVPESDDANLSRHLASRVEVEHTLAATGVPVTTLRASLVVGRKGSSFQILSRLVARLPVMLCPRWTKSLTQPIALDDVVKLLAYCGRTPSTAGQVYAVGGPDTLTYRDLLRRTAAAMGKRRWLIPFPYFTPGLSRLWVTLITGAPKELVAPLVQSLHHDMVASERRLQKQAGIPGDPLDVTLRACVEEEANQKKGAKPPRAYLKAVEDSDVRSVQRLVRPPGRDADWAGREYLRWLPGLAPWILRIDVDGDFCRLRLRGMRTPLFVLEYATARSGPDRALFYLRGGSLTRESARGRLEFRETVDGKSYVAALHEYRPRLPWFLYKASQAIVHALVMKAFGRHLRKHFTGATLSKPA